jgi:hypothetical protein
MLILLKLVSKVCFITFTNCTGRALCSGTSTGTGTGTGTGTSIASRSNALTDLS